MAVTVLMVAEKPSIAFSIASVLSSGKMGTRRSRTDVHEFDEIFRGSKAHYKVTSVIGHVMSTDFPPTYQNWETTDPFDLFQASVMKVEANPKANIRKHLQHEAQGCDYLVLWLDCDREGENICFEVIGCTVNVLRKGAGQKVFRARFSAVAERDIRNAMSNLVEPNKNESLAVDARQEIDLKVGVAFTRFQTRYFQGKYGNLDSSVISYGPCQTPTLGFCVERHLQITMFKAEPFWVVRPCIDKGGYRICLVWDRHKVFDKVVGLMFQRMINNSGSAKVVNITEKVERKSRPSGLNTVNLLKVASSGLGMGPNHAMQVAERLYTQGYISYPRTESTAYPSTFDFGGTLKLHCRNPEWGSYIGSLLPNGFHPPKLGNDAGDHPPITPMKSATEAELGSGDAWKLYQYITQHFIATVSPDCIYKRKRIDFIAGGEKFHCTGQTVVSPGFTSIMPWLAITEESLPTFCQLDVIPLSEVELYEGITSPPSYLTESELISLMERHGIGTDASIPVHINNICERNYAQVHPGRKLIPTVLGITLIRGYQSIDADLCLPEIRSFIEQQITLIAKGQADHDRVVNHALEQFSAKYTYFTAQVVQRAKFISKFVYTHLHVHHLFRQHSNGKEIIRLGNTRFATNFILLDSMQEVRQALIDMFVNPLWSHDERFASLRRTTEARRMTKIVYDCVEAAGKFWYEVKNVIQIGKMDTLFEAQFSPLADSGRLLSKCGKCNHYMKYISVRPSRLYCGTCEEVYSLPQNGTIKLYKELVCPVDGFELLLFSLPGPDGKSYSLCPYCYNNPPFEDMDVLLGKAKKNGGMPCSLCSHPTCCHSVIRRGVCACPECDGTLVLDPISAPRWRLDCNKCNCLVYLPQNCHKVVTVDEHCNECGSKILEVDFNKNSTPLDDGTTLHRACILCDDLLHSMIEMKHGKSFIKRSGKGKGRFGRHGRGRTRGRGRGHGHGHGGNDDPKMSFRDF